MRIEGHSLAAINAYLETPACRKEFGLSQLFANKMWLATCRLQPAACSLSIISMRTWERRQRQLPSMAAVLKPSMVAGVDTGVAQLDAFLGEGKLKLLGLGNVLDDVDDRVC